jgi:hypothetical protein
VVCGIDIDVVSQYMVYMVYMVYNCVYYCDNCVYYCDNCVYYCDIVSIIVILCLLL